MSLLIALVRLTLSLIFGVAGITKLLDQPGTREAVRNFGAPNSLAPAIALVLPLAELAIAAGLPFSSSAWWSAVAGLMLLGLFAVAISVNLAQGRTHDCHCFGQLHSKPLGWATLARNLVFGAGASLVLWQELREASPNIFTTISETLIQLNTVQSVLLIALLIAGAGLLFFLQRRQKRSTAEVSEPTGLPLNSVAPSFELDAYSGGKRSLAQLLDYGKPLLLIFTNPSCGPCVVLFEEIKDWQHSHGDQLTIALISLGTIKENFVNVARNRLGQVLLQQKREIAEQYGANATPTAVVVSTEGRIASPLAAGAGEIRKLLQNVLGNSHGSNDHDPRPSED